MGAGARVLPLSALLFMILSGLAFAQGRPEFISPVITKGSYEIEGACHVLALIGQPHPTACIGVLSKL
jgi:hypothetical protein